MKPSFVPIPFPNGLLSVVPAHSGEEGRLGESTPISYPMSDLSPPGPREAITVQMPSFVADDGLLCAVIAPPSGKNVPQAQARCRYRRDGAGAVPGRKAHCGLVAYKTMVERWHTMVIVGLSQTTLGDYL